MKEIIGYTDGSAVVVGKNKGKGGFGVYFPDFYGKPKGIKGRSNDTKTGAMELTALFYAIDAFDINGDPIKLIIYSDSQYVVKSFTENRLQKWEANGWRNSSGEVKNLDLWKKVLKQLEGRPWLTLEMRWIKGHQLDKERDEIRKSELLKDPHIVGNAMADILADYKT